MAVDPHELAPGIWCWQTRRYGWDDDRDFRAWDLHHAVVTDDAVVLVDPSELSAATGLDDWLAETVEGRSLHVAMTDGTDQWSTGEGYCRTHGGTVWGTPKTADRLADPSLLQVLETGIPGPAGVVALEIGEPVRLERPLWFPALATLVFGEIVARAPNPGDELRVWEQDIVDERVERWFRHGIAPTFDGLLRLPVERILMSHGDAVEHDAAGALRRAVDAGPWSHRAVV